MSKVVSFLVRSFIVVMGLLVTGVALDIGNKSVSKIANNFVGTTQADSQVGFIAYGVALLTPIVCIFLWAMYSKHLAKKKK